jgi:hypothetical protein
MDLGGPWQENPAELGQGQASTSRRLSLLSVIVRARRGYAFMVTAGLRSVNGRRPQGYQRPQRYRNPQYG